MTEAYSANLEQLNKKRTTRILHVDDNFAVQEITKVILQDFDSCFEIDQASCVDEALRKLETERYDAVISDYEMPQKDGLEFLNELRKSKNQIPFILFTGKGREEVAIKALNLGADGYINKQCNPETVYGELAHTLHLSVERHRSKVEMDAHALAFQMVDNAIISADQNRTIIYWNKAAEKIFGYLVSEVVGKKMEEIFVPMQLDVSFQEVAQILQEKGKFCGEVSFKNKNGELRQGEITIIFQSNGCGKVLGSTTICQDITESKKVIGALRESENRLKKISSQTPGMLFQFKKQPDGNYCVPFASEAILNIFGCSPQDVQNDFSPIVKVILPEDLDRVFNTIEFSAKNLTVWNCEYRVRIPGKDVHWLWGQSIPEKQPDGSIVWSGYNFDITEKKRVEESLLENQQKFSALFEANPEAAIFYSNDFHVIDVNQRFSSLFGYSLDEIKGKDIVDLIVPDDAKDESENIRQKLKSGSVETFTTRKRKDGVELPLLVSGSSVLFGEKVIGSIFVFKDISDIITAQEELSKALVKAELLNEKLHVVGSLTRHDVRNKLSAIPGYSYILKRKYSDKTVVFDSLAKMEQSVKDAMKIFDFAKAYEQLGVEELVDVDVGKVVDEAAEMFSSLPFKVINECKGLTVHADSLLRQLIYNFIDNTRKYGQETSVAKIRYERVVGGLQLIYEDDGVGVPLENKGQLFKKGFSTGGSTGFGLFLSKKMIEVYGWTITEKGEPGKGAKFVILIPTPI